MAEKSPVVEARIVDFRMPFWSMVGFLVQLAIAAIPAIIILSIVVAILAAALGGVVAGIGAALGPHDPAPISQNAPTSPEFAAPKIDKESSAIQRLRNARLAATARCEKAFPPGDEQLTCITQEGDCVRRYGENVDPTSPKAAAQLACFEAVHRQR